MTEQPIRHAAVVGISTNILLRLMEFHNGGIVHRAFTKDEYINTNTIYLVIEHPDLPAVPIDQRLPEIGIILQTTYGENGVPVKIERISPPKADKPFSVLTPNE